jgi:YcxB-like protein
VATTIGSSKKSGLWIYIIISLMACINIVLSYLNDNIDLFSIIFFPLILLMYFLFRKIYYPRLMKKYINKLYDNPLNKNLIGEVEYTFSNDKIVFKKQYLYSEFEWPYLSKCVENDDYFFVFLNSVQAIIIPKNFSVINENDLCHLLKSKIKDYQVI